MQSVPAHNPRLPGKTLPNALLNYAESIFLAGLPNNIAGTKAKLGFVFLSSLEEAPLVRF